MPGPTAVPDVLVPQTMLIDRGDHRAERDADQDRATDVAGDERGGQSPRVRRNTSTRQGREVGGDRDDRARPGDDDAAVRRSR